MKNKLNLKTGSIYYVDLGEPKDHCIAKVRPCAILYEDRQTVNVIPITNNDKGKPDNSDIPIPDGIGNLKKKSKLKMGQIHTIDKCKIVSKQIGRLNSEIIVAIQNFILTKTKTEIIPNFIPTVIP